MVDIHGKLAVASIAGEEARVALKLFLETSGLTMRQSRTREGSATSSKPVTPGAN